MSWCHVDPARGRLTLTLHIQPNARVTSIAGRHGDALKIRIAAPARENEANAALIDFLHQWFKLASSRITIRQGKRGRRKIVVLDVSGTEFQTLLASMEAACPANSSNA